MSSYGYFSNPTAAGNTVTVNSGSMTVSKATAYANQTVVAPQTALKIGEFNVTTGSTEALNLNQFTLGFTGATAHFTSLQDVYVTYGAKSTVIKSTVASTSNTFSVNEVVPAGTTLSVKVYATVNSSVPAASVITATLGVDATSQSSGNTVATVTATGQNITVGAGTLTVAIDASTPIAALAVGNSMPIIASYKFTSSNDAFTIVDLSATTTNSSSIIELVFKDGATELGRQPFNGTSLTKTGLNLLVPANTNKVVTVYASLGSVGTNAGDTGANIQLTLTSVKSRNSNGVEATTAYVNGISGNAMYVYKTKPTITNNALPNGTVLNSGSQTVYAYKVTADVGGTVAWRTIKFNVASSSPSGSFSVGTFNLYDAANQSSVLTNTLCTLSGATVTCTSSTDQEVSGSKDYVLKATVTGSIVTGATISVNIPSSSLAHANPTDVVSAQATTASFVWSDEALTPHTGASLSWNNDNLVKVIPTDSETLTK